MTTGKKNPTRAVSKLNLSSTGEHHPQLQPKPMNPSSSERQANPDGGERRRRAEPGCVPSAADVFKSTVSCFAHKHLGWENVEDGSRGNRMLQGDRLSARWTRSGSVRVLDAAQDSVVACSGGRSWQRLQLSSELTEN